MRRTWRIISAAGLLLAATLSSRLLATPGTLITRDGHTVLGDITETPDAVTIVLHGIPSRYDRHDVASVIYNGTVQQQFHERLSKLAADDVRGRMELAAWANQQQQPALAVEALQQARDIDPADRQAALDLLAAERQEDLDTLRHPSTAPAQSAATAAPATRMAMVPAGFPAALPPPAFRLLNDDEVNRLRQKDLPDAGGDIVLKFQNDLVRRYLARTHQNAREFRALPLDVQARQILADGDPDFTNDVRVMTNPPALAQFRQRLMPVIAQSCGSIACHGSGTLRGGSFELFTGDRPTTVYTNYFVLQNYATTVDGTEYRMIDRTMPTRSLLLQFALPADQAAVRHPPVRDYHPRFRSTSDPVYQQLLSWITDALAPIEPDYGIRVLAQPTTSEALPPQQ